jgi:sugar/nucleoside kinase (ribokinase family)
VEAVDTLGAGDSFATAFLLSYIETGKIGPAMEAGAEFAAKTCMQNGAFGHGVTFEE